MCANRTSSHRLSSSSNVVDTLTEGCHGAAAAEMATG